MADVLVVAAAVAVAGLVWVFLGPRQAGTVVLAGGLQRVRVLVRGGYRPDVIRVGALRCPLRRRPAPLRHPRGGTP